MSIWICFIIFVIFILFWSLVIFRINLIYKHRIKALRIISKYSKKMIYDEKCSVFEWAYLYKMYNKYPNFDEMYKNWKKWKFEDFFSDLEERCKKIYEISIND